MGSPVTTVRSLLFPVSIAVVGASPRNLAAVETVVASGVTAWGVNPNRDEVAGLRCYRGIIADFQRRVHTALTSER